MFEPPLHSDPNLVLSPILEDPSRNIGELPDASRAEHRRDEVAAKSTPQGAVAGRCDRVSVKKRERNKKGK